MELNFLLRNYLKHRTDEDPITDSLLEDFLLALLQVRSQAEGSGTDKEKLRRIHEIADTAIAVLKRRD